MSIASRRAKAAIRRAMVKVRALTGRGRYQERVADIAVAFHAPQARTLTHTPRQLKEDAQQVSRQAGELDTLATTLVALASTARQERKCSKCGETIRGDEGLAAALVGMAGNLQGQAAQMRAMAQDLRQQAQDVDRAAERIGMPGATLWYGRRGQYG